MIKHLNSIIAINFSLVIVLVLTLSSCANKDKVSNTKSEAEQSSKAYTTKVSPRTQLLLGAYNKELKASKKEPKVFKPSEELVQKYSLVQLNDNEVYVKGMATFKDNFDKKTLTDLAIKVGSKLGSQTSVQVPLHNLETFLQAPHIAYFEIAEKAQLKNQ